MKSPASTSNPILIEAINRRASEDAKPVFHDMRLGKGNDSSRLQRDDSDMHVVTHVRRIDERIVVAHRPPVSGMTVGAMHHFIQEKRRWCFNAIYRFIGFAHPIERTRALDMFNACQFVEGGNEGIAAGLQDVSAPLPAIAELRIPPPRQRERLRLADRFQDACCHPPAPLPLCIVKKFPAKPDSGLAMIQQRVFSQNRQYSL